MVGDTLNSYLFPSFLLKMNPHQNNSDNILKIAYIYDAIYPWVKGGAEKRVYEIAIRLVERGHQVHWFGLKWWEGEDDIVRNGIQIHGIGKWDSLYDNGTRSIKEGIYFGIKTLMKVKGDFDVIDCQQFPYFSCFSAKIYSMITNTPLAITWIEVWNDYWYEYLGTKGVFGKLIENITAKLTDKNLSISEHTKTNLYGMTKNVVVIPHGIQFERIQTIKTAHKSDVIFAGRLIKEKNVDILIKSIKIVKEKIPDIKCYIIGDGPEKNNLEKLTTDLKVENNITFLGFLENHDNVISYMKASKVFVLPSTREGFGIVALEANACGLPVIIINHKNNAAKEIIENGKNGFACELSEKEVSKHILISLKKRESMKFNCIEKAKEYDWDIIIDNVERLYSKYASRERVNPIVT